MSKKKYTITAEYHKGKKCYVPVDEYGGELWGEAEESDIEDEMEFACFRVDEYDERGIWVCHERRAIDDWYSKSKKMDLLRRIESSHPESEWERMV